MENTAPFQVTLLLVKGTVQSISNFKIVVETESSGLVEIYVPRNLPLATGDEIEAHMEMTIYGFIGRRVTKLQTGETFPLFPYDFLILSEHLRYGIFTGIIFIAFIVLGGFYNLYLFSITLPVFFGILSLIFLIEAIGVGFHVPNYLKANLLPLAGVLTEDLPQFTVKNANPPLFFKSGKLERETNAIGKFNLQINGETLEIATPPSANYAKNVDIEEPWIFRFRGDQIHILGLLECEGTISWHLAPLIQTGPLFEIAGLVIYFLSILPGYWAFMLSFFAPLPPPFSLWFFVTSMLIGECLIILGEFARLTKTRILNRTVVEYI